jgi:nucleoside-diphosphate-sugar epimerase
VNFDFSNQLVFVTGFDGFLGSCLVSVLLEKGVTVIGLSRNFNGKKEQTYDFSEHDRFYIKLIDEDIRDLLNDRKLEDLKTACFHFAGNASAIECQNNPEMAYESNVLLTLGVLEYCKSIGINRFIYPSTGYVYGNQLINLADENSPLISHNIYTSTKIAAEALIESYANSYKMSCTIGRISNVFGGEISTETVSGSILNSILIKEKIVLNTVKPVRDFIFIEDVIEAFLAFLVESENSVCNYYNISTGVATSIKKLAEIACKLESLPKSNIISKNLDRYSNTRLVLSNEKIKKTIGWAPKFSIEEGLRIILNKKEDQ